MSLQKNNLDFKLASCPLSAKWLRFYLKLQIFWLVTNSLLIISDIYNLVIIALYNQDYLWRSIYIVILEVIRLGLIIGTNIHLRQFTPKGYKINMYLLGYVPICIGLFCIPPFFVDLDVNRTASIIFQSVLFFLCFSLPNIIYFQKRSFLFGVQNTGTEKACEESSEDSSEDKGQLHYINNLKWIYKRNRQNSGEKTNIQQCPKCGNAILEEYSFCPNCKKKLHRNHKNMPKRTTVAIIFLALSTAISSVCAIVFFYSYTKEANDKAYYISRVDAINSEKMQLQKENDELHSNNITLQNENNELRGNNESLKSENDGYMKRIKDLTDSQNSINTRNIVVPVPENSYLDNLDTKCAIPSCNNNVDRIGTHIYCFWHECSESGCINLKDDNLSSYCAIHRCQYPDCHSKRKNNSYYCYFHSIN